MVEAAVAATTTEDKSDRRRRTDHHRIRDSRRKLMTNCTMTITGRNNQSLTIGRSGINRFPKERPKEDQPETGTEAERNENPDKGARENPKESPPVPAKCYR